MGPGGRLRNRLPALGVLLRSVLFAMKKRPFASEGHLHLPQELGPQRETQPPADVLPGGLLVRAGRGPFVSNGHLQVLRVRGAGLAELDLHDRDELHVDASRTAEHGDLAIVDVEGVVRVAKVYPDAGDDASVLGVVVAIKRPLPGSSTHG